MNRDNTQQPIHAYTPKSTLTGENDSRNDGDRIENDGDDSRSNSGHINHQTQNLDQDSFGDSQRQSAESDSSSDSQSSSSSNQYWDDKKEPSLDDLLRALSDVQGRMADPLKVPDEPQGPTPPYYPGTHMPYEGDYYGRPPSTSNEYSSA